MEDIVNITEMVKERDRLIAKKMTKQLYDATRLAELEKEIQKQRARGGAAPSSK